MKQESKDAIVRMLATGGLETRKAVVTIVTTIRGKVKKVTHKQTRKQNTYLEENWKPRKQVKEVHV